MPSNSCKDDCVFPVGKSYYSFLIKRISSLLPKLYMCISLYGSGIVLTLDVTVVKSWIRFAKVYLSNYPYLCIIKFHIPRRKNIIGIL